jgi:hypothetical protein
MSEYKIQTGVSVDPRRVVIYSQPGMGKTTLASYTPAPIFVQVEDGLAGIGADRLPLVKDYDDFTEQLRWLYKNKNGYKTLVIDSVDALNRHIENIVCKRNVVDSIAQIPYGGGYKLVAEEWGQLLAKTLQAFRDTGMNIVLISHSAVERFEDPGMLSYDRTTLAIDKRAARIVTGWADDIFYIRRDVTLRTDKSGFTEKKRADESDERFLISCGSTTVTAKSRSQELSAMGKILLTDTALGKTAFDQYLLPLFKQ